MRFKGTISRKFTLLKFAILPTDTQNYVSILWEPLAAINFLQIQNHFEIWATVCTFHCVYCFLLYINDYKRYYSQGDLESLDFAPRTGHSVAYSDIYISLLWITLTLFNGWLYELFRITRRSRHNREVSDCSLQYTNVKCGCTQQTAR